MRRLLCAFVVRKAPKTDRGTLVMKLKVYHILQRILGVIICEIKFFFRNLGISGMDYIYSRRKIYSMH